MKKIFSVIFIVLAICILSSCSNNTNIKNSSASKLSSSDSNKEKNTNKQSFDNVLNDYIKSEDIYWNDIEDTDVSDFDYHFVNKKKDKVIFDNLRNMTERAKKELDDIDTYVSITGFKGDSGVIKIPQKIKGYKVMSVALNSPYLVNGEVVHSFSNLTSLYIPDSVVDLNLNGYYNSVQQLRLPNKECCFTDNSRMTSLTTIYYKSICGQIPITQRDSLQKIFINNGVKDILITRGTLLKCSPNLQKVYIPSSVKIIGEENLELTEKGTILSKKEKNIFKGLMNVNIVTQKNSYAENYAKKYNIKCEILD